MASILGAREQVAGPLKLPPDVEVGKVQCDAGVMFCRGHAANSIGTNRGAPPARNLSDSTGIHSAEMFGVLRHTPLLHLARP
jgi:hypothetical protein